MEVEKGEKEKEKKIQRKVQRKKERKIKRKRYREQKIMITFPVFVKISMFHSNPITSIHFLFLSLFLLSLSQFFASKMQKEKEKKEIATSVTIVQFDCSFFLSLPLSFSNAIVIKEVHRTLSFLSSCFLFLSLVLQMQSCNEKNRAWVLLMSLIQLVVSNQGFLGWKEIGGKSWN